MKYRHEMLNIHDRHASVTYHIVFKFQFIMLKYQHTCIMKKYQHTCMVIMMKYHRTLLYEYNPHKALSNFNTIL